MPSFQGAAANEPDASPGKRTRLDLEGSSVAPPQQQAFARTPAPARRKTQLGKTAPRPPKPPPAPWVPVATTPAYQRYHPRDPQSIQRGPRQAFQYFDTQTILPNKPVSGIFGGGSFDSSTTSNVTSSMTKSSSSFPTGSSSAATSFVASSSQGNPPSSSFSSHKQPGKTRTEQAFFGGGGSSFASRVKQRYVSKPVSWVANTVSKMVEKKEKTRRHEIAAKLSFESNSSFEPTTPGKGYPSEGLDPPTQMNFGTPPIAQSTPSRFQSSAFTAGGRSVSRLNQKKSWDGRVEDSTAFINSKAEAARKALLSNKEDKRAEAKDSHKRKHLALLEDYERDMRDERMARATQDLGESTFAEPTFAEESTEVDSDSEIEEAQDTARTPTQSQFAPQTSQVGFCFLDLFASILTANSHFCPHRPLPRLGLLSLMWSTC